MLIGIIGKKQSGKDTVANYLVQNYKFEQTAFADPLKRVCTELFALDDIYFHDDQLKEVVVEQWGMSPRQMLQRVGTDMVRRHLGDLFWVTHLQRRLDKLAPFTRVVISDVRFVSEAMFIKSRGGILVRVKRQSDENDNQDEHISEIEQEIIKEDISLFNFSTKQELYQQIDSQMGSIVSTDVLEIV